MFSPKKKAAGSFWCSPAKLRIPPAKTVLTSGSGMPVWAYPNSSSTPGPSLPKGTSTPRCAGNALGVDWHVWLHQLAYAHAEDIIVRRDYLPLAKAFLQQAQSIMGQGVQLLFVFDGDPTRAKRVTDMARQQRRQRAYNALLYGEQR